MYQNKDLLDPNLLFERRMILMRNRIQVLVNDYNNVNHFFSKAIIETELEKLVDDYLERSFVLQRTNEQRRKGETENGT